jgi:3-oxoacyl-[acyl-carrier protein] reductase
MHIADDLEKIEAEAKEAAGSGGGAIHAMLADVRHPQDCEDVVNTAMREFGALHVLVNNAGMGMLLISDDFQNQPPRFWQADTEPVRAILETNLLGPFHMARPAVPHMLEGGWGRVVNVTTSIITMQRGGVYPYGPAKAGLEASSRSWAEDLADTGVTVNVLIPGGAVNTDMLPDSNRKSMQAAAGRALLEPEIMAAPILWLASGASDGVTGMRFIAAQWDTSLEPGDAAAKVMAPAGFDARSADAAS